MRRALLGLFCALATASCMPVLEGQDYHLEGQEVRLTILHTSDIHSRIIPYDFTPLKTDQDLGLVPEAGPFGGAARMAGILKRERTKGDRILHLDSGDCFQGAPIFNVNTGEVEFRFLSRMHADAAVVGNHEFDAGALNFVQKARDFATFPLLAANYKWDDWKQLDNNQAELVTSPYTLKVIKGVRVGVIGMANISSLNSIVEGGNSLQATPLEQNEAARAYVELLRPVTDLLVVVSHLGLTEDQDLIQGYEAYYEYGKITNFLERPTDKWTVLEWFGPEGDPKSVVRVHIPGVSGLDVVLGGHLHVVLNPPQLIADPSGRKVVLSHSGAFAKYVGRLDLVVKMPEVLGQGEGAEVISEDYQVFPLDALWCNEAMRKYRFDPRIFWEAGKFIQAPGVREAIEQCRQKEDAETTDLLVPYILGMDFNLQLTSIFSYAPKDVQRRNTSTGGDSPLGNIAADSMRKRKRVEAEVALTNSLGIRDNLYAGVVTQEAMFNVFPFENTINIMYLSGLEMQEMFDFVAERSSERGCVSQAQISGAKFTMDCAQVQLNDLRIPCSQCPADNREGHAPWQCLEDVNGARCWAHPATDIQINGKALDPNGTYRVAVNDYIAKGGSGFTVLKRNTTRQETGISLRDSLIGYMQNFCTCDDINAGHATRGGVDGAQPCGSLVNGVWTVDDATKASCRRMQDFEDELSVRVGSCSCGDLLKRGYDPKGCGAENVTTPEQAQQACMSGKKVGSCTCGELQGRDYNPSGCNAPDIGTVELAKAACTTSPGPYTGRCTCRDVLAGNNPTCGNVTLQLRNFCENPTAMPLANALDDGRIGRRVK
ncbi:bifunctional metallophosphatase/5'-nucleotidase [Corallococcus sp. H22C18031201]|uniref:bifunctional metallophosphatase/5'-nucleotidase n=1 Tax=Citreicoccus inhibens TaxID=2849499 RepID=UPI000E752625|nr:bifunctional UDP-sugar hydrolase/5'-nucleotidase [Citreicoccus inhibens]MBU8898240.1 bifunctional metallophosphatase/5'-nucleotidase [Citreicoccus inhibens]RJS26971.1 bifunctional metallophosphatase/5'-nucleotidase [Corallococcus sp. H22C18031201]